MIARGALAATLVLALGAGRAHAWDSICYEFLDPTKPVAELAGPASRGCEGPLATRGRWRDPVHWLDEHRVILRQAMLAGGLPPALLETVVLSVPTLGGDIDIGNGFTLPTQSPLPLDYAFAIDHLERRGFALDELAQLPDFSYSLADWANGNERCPVDELAALAPAIGNTLACHSFKTHMGALNASHFPPQSDRWYRWMHDLALARAGECKAMRAGAWAGFADPADADAFDDRWTPVWRECEVEALALEAVAQHYLQDSWSSGHMWQRWGSTKLTDFPATTSMGFGPWTTSWNDYPDDQRRLMTGEIVGLLAGTIHGSDGPMYEAVSTIAADPASYPSDASIAYVSGGAAVPAAGDMHLHDVLGDPLSTQLFGRTAQTLHDHYSLVSLAHTPSAALAPQSTALLGCATGSVREVYDRLADPATFGAPSHGAATGAAPPPGACAAPRLSARALAASIDGEMVAPMKYSVAAVSGGVLAAPPPDVSNRAFHSYDEMRRVAKLMAIHQPLSTEVADLTWDAFEYDQTVCLLVTSPENGCDLYGDQHVLEPAGELPLLGVDRNGAHAVPPGDQPADFADPPLPWGDPAMPAALVDDSPEQYLASAFHRAHAPLWCARTSSADLTEFQTRARNAPAATKVEACRVCTEVVARHVRPPGGQALCEVLQPGSQILDGDDDPTREAESLCGCADNFVAVSDSGLRFVAVDPAGSPTVVGGPYPAGTLTRDATAATRRRIFTTNGQGDIVGFRWAGFASPVATELDLTPGDPATTRLHLGGDPRGIAFVESLGRDWLLVVDGASDLLRVYDLGTELTERFELCSTVDVGRDPARVEGAWDLTVLADGTRGFVTFRGPLGTPGDAIAMFDPGELFTCDAVNPMITHVTTFGGGMGLGAMALSPDQQHLAVAARLRTTCLDRVYTNTSGTQIDTQVGCDLVWVLRVDQLAPGPLSATAPVTFGARTSLPTRPVSYPYAVAWRPDGASLAYGSFLGLSPWPLYANMNAQGAVALGVLGAPTFPAGAQPQHWSYNASLGGSVAGETVEYSASGHRLLVGSMDGKLYSFPGDPAHDFWRNRESDPESLIHAGAILRSWYGGCRVAGTCPGGWCPLNCPAGAADAVRTLDVGSPIRKLLRL